MASIVKIKDKRSGITYAYSSVSYWDKEKKAPRNRRTLIGRVDETTGEIVPTDGRGKKRMHTNNPTPGTTESIKQLETIRASTMNMQSFLKQEIEKLEHYKTEVQSTLNTIDKLIQDMETENELKKTTPVQ